LYRTVTALGAELRRQGALGLTAEPKVDLIDLAYAAIAAADRGSAKASSNEENPQLTTTVISPAARDELSPRTI
jgi:hypothetical protein